MFRSSTIIRELALNLAKVICMLKHSWNYVVIYYAVVWQHAAYFNINSNVCFKIKVQFVGEWTLLGLVITW